MKSLLRCLFRPTIDDWIRGKIEKLRREEIQFTLISIQYTHHAEALRAQMEYLGSLHPADVLLRDEASGKLEYPVFKNLENTLYGTQESQPKTR